MTERRKPGRASKRAEQRAEASSAARRRPVRRRPEEEPVEPTESQPTEAVDAPEGAEAVEPTETASADSAPAPVAPEIDEAADAARVARRNALFPVGIDYHPFDDERGSVDEWYGGDIEGDFERFAAARLSLARVLISWPFFEPQVGQYADEAEERLVRLVAAARANKMQVIVTFFSDDRMAELTDVPWGRKRDARTDPYLIQREVALVQRIVNKLRSETAVFAWDLADESFLTGFTSAEDLATWAEALRDAIREIDTERPITIGADSETFFRATGVDPRPVLDSMEFVVSHRTAPYETYMAQGPQTWGPGTYLDSFLLRLARRDLPVLVDGVGAASLDAALAQEAAQVRTAMYAAMMNRAAGVMLRRWRDVDTEKREPYFRDPYEVLVGVADHDGHTKPALAEARRVASVVARLDLRRYTMLQERVAVLVPAERYEPLPSMAGLYGPRAALQAYMLAKEAHVPVEVVREGDEIGHFFALIVPSVTRLSPETWEELREFVYGGGALIMSYGGGDPDPAVRELFGVEFLGDAGTRTTFACRVAQSGLLGDIASFDGRLEVPDFAQLTASGATVVATDAVGGPLVTLNTFGQGRTVWISAPVERALAQGHAFDPGDQVRGFMRTIYAAVCTAAGGAGPFACDRPEVELALFNGERDDIMLLLNHAPEKITAQITADKTVATVADVRGGAASPVGARTFGVPLGPNGAAALRLTYG